MGVRAPRRRRQSAAARSRRALDATEKWIAQPTDDNRRAAMDAGEKAHFSTPAGCAGLAAFFSGGSLAPPEAPPCPPAGVSNGQGGCRRRDFRRRESRARKGSEKFQSFVAQGVDVSNRVNLWSRSQRRREHMGMPAATSNGHARLPHGDGAGAARGRPDSAPLRDHGADRRHCRPARVGDMAVCVGPPDVIALGSFTVLTMSMPQARMWT